MEWVNDNVKMMIWNLPGLYVVARACLVLRDDLSPYDIKVLKVDLSPHVIKVLKYSRMITKS
jgi:hypothetical protein